MPMKAMERKRYQWINFVVGPASEKGKAEDKKPDSANRPARAFLLYELYIPFFIKGKMLGYL